MSIYNIYKDLAGNPIPLDYLKDANNSDHLHVHLKYKESKFYLNKVKIVGKGWSDYTDEDGMGYTENIEVIVHYAEEEDLIDVIKVTEKLLTETSFVKNIDSIVEIKTLN